MIGEGQRARSSDQKEQRRDALVAAARNLYERGGYEYTRVTMADIASAAHLAKGTVFLYFTSKEALFLSLLTELLDEGFVEVDAQLSVLPCPAEPAEVATIICRSLDGREGMTRLLAILHTTLEQNVEYDGVMSFKKMLSDHLATTGSLLERCLPFLKAGEGARLLLRVDALIIGLYHLTSPSPVVKDALAHPDMAIFTLDFGQELFSTIMTLFAGLRA